MSSAHVVVITPRLDGADGIGEVSRQVMRALTLAGGVEVHSLAAGGRPRFVAGLLWAAARVPRRTTVCVLHLHLLPAALPLRWRGAALWTVLHGIEAWERLSGSRLLAMRHTAGVIADSAYTAARFRQANPRLAALPLCVCHPACPAPVTPGQSGATPGFALIVGRLAAAERYKGHDLLLEAWPLVMAAHPGARLVVVGDGDDRARLERKALELGVAGAVTFCGAVAADALAALYRDAAFFVMPSVGEGFGLVYLEAMQAGLACIAAPGAAAEIIEDGKTGLVIDVNVAGVAGAVVRLFTDPDMRSRLGHAGRESVQRRFTAERYQRELTGVLGLAGHPPC